MRIWVQFKRIFNSAEYVLILNPVSPLVKSRCSADLSSWSKTDKYTTYCIYWMSFLSAIVWAMMTHWWLIYTPMTQFIAYGSCVLRDFNAVSPIFENFTHLRLGSGVAHVSQHQENYAKTYAYSIIKSLELSLIFVFASWYIDLLCVPPYCKYFVGAIRVKI